MRSLRAHDLELGLLFGKQLAAMMSTRHPLLETP